MENDDGGMLGGTWDYATDWFTSKPTIKQIFMEEPHRECNKSFFHAV